MSEAEDKESKRLDHANTRVHPPTIFLGALVFGWFMRLISSVAFDRESVWAGRLPIPRAVGEGAGGALAMAGIGLFAWAAFVFRRHGEEFPPNTPTHMIVQKGPYRFSRNPIYLSMALFGVGLSLATANGWMLLMTAIAMIIIHIEVILREEAYLSGKFGESYEAYKRRVRRWI